MSLSLSNRLVMFALKSITFFGRESFHSASFALKSSHLFERESFQLVSFALKSRSLSLSLSLSNRLVMFALKSIIFFGRESFHDVIFALKVIVLSSSFSFHDVTFATNSTSCAGFFFVKRPFANSTTSSPKDGQSIPANISTMFSPISSPRLSQSNSLTKPTAISIPPWINSAMVAPRLFPLSLSPAIQLLTALARASPTPL